jgi:hypothetical protein
MKKYIFGILAIILMASPAFAQWDVVDMVQFQKRMNSVGFNLLNSSRIENRMTFKVINRVYTRDMCSDVSFVNRTVWIKPSVFPYIDSDDELAGILSHQIAHGVDSYEGIFRGYASVLNYWVAPNKYDLKADKRAVDYMVNAGYNPLALIVIINKIGKQYRYDVFSNHTLLTRRMMKIYEYIYKKYPSILVDNEYKDNIYYQNFLLTSRANRAMLRDKIESGSTKKLDYKY